MAETLEGIRPPAEQTQSDGSVGRNAEPGSEFAVKGVADAILHAVIYADLFDYPLTAPQIHRYLVECAAPLDLVEEHLARDSRLAGWLGSEPPFWFLTGRESLVGIRREREAYAGGLWPHAWRYGHLIAVLPFVRMTAVSGALAMNNVTEAQDDIDLLVVVQSGRVWLARGFVILVVHLARRLGVEVCPNYVIAEERLHLGVEDLFTAHELAQLVPLYGLDAYARLIECNAWLRHYLPNASPRQTGALKVGKAARGLQRLAEVPLHGRLGDVVEEWERERKVPRLRRVAAERRARGAFYGPDLCKGHVDDHGTNIREQYSRRLAALRLAPVEPQ